MPPDDRDYRVRCDLTFPPEKQGIAIGLMNHIVAQMDQAINLNPGHEFEEIGKTETERCGHRLGLPCEVVERWQVGRGKVIG